MLRKTKIKLIEIFKDMIEDIKKGDVKLLGIATRQQFNSIKYEGE